MREMTEAERAYLAGMIDGEGCIYIAEASGRYFQMKLVIVGTNEDHIRRCADMCGLGSVHYVASSGPRAARWQWHVVTNQAVSLLRAVMPYLYLKAQQAQLALDFQEHMDNSPSYNGRHPIPAAVLRYRRQMADTMKALKTDGKVFNDVAIEVESPAPMWRARPLCLD